ncbi:hypothetical protein FRC12_024092 [Ceratobasidium sp. 428]|nr:hypothetical protein FRC12_024092 [Ceratobasidium sp. 428]
MLLVEMGPLKCVMAVVWIHDRRMILGCIDGTIYDAKLASKLTRASIVVWEKGVGKRGKKVWETVQSLDLSATLPASARTHTLRFMGSDPGRLIVGTEAGVWIWIFQHREQLILLSDLTKVYDIGAIAFALDDSLIAVSSLEHTVLIWPITPTFEVLSILSRHYTPESGQEWQLWEPHVPITITDQHRISPSEFETKYGFSTVQDSVLLISPTPKRHIALEQSRPIEICSMLRIQFWWGW